MLVRKVLPAIAICGVLAFGATAASADGRYHRGSIKDAPYKFSWTGFYAGANIGYAFSGDEEIGLTTNLGGFARAGDFELSGFFGGLQAGYNWHLSPSLVFGIEGDIQLSGVDDKVGPNATVPAGGIVRGSSDVQWLGTLRGRLGWAADRTLFYATGGLAFAGVDYVVNFTNGVNTSVMKNDDTLTGYVVGGGIEHAFSNRWSLKFEYQYINLGKEAVIGPLVPPVAGVTSLRTLRIIVESRSVSV